jgi:hypothetical protein
MSGTPDNTPPSDDPSDDEIDQDIPVLRVEAIDLPKTTLPERRHSDRTARAEVGLRIGPPVVRPVDTEARADGTLRLEVKELSKGVIKLKPEIKERESFFEPLPVMTPLSPPPAVEQSETIDWGEASHPQSLQWLWWAGAAVLVAVIAGFLIQPILNKQRGERGDGYYENFDVEVDRAPPEDPSLYFGQNMPVLEPQMRQLLKQYAAAQSIDKVIPLIRNGEALRGRLRKQWKPLNVPAGWEPSSEVMLGYDSIGSLPYAFMQERLPDGESITVYFVQGEDRLYIDWEATAASGTAAWDELIDPDLREVTVRGFAFPVSYFTAAYPEAAYLCFRFDHGMNEESPLWVYAKRESAAAAQLAAFFRGGAILEANQTPQAVTLHLTRAKDAALPNQWEVAEVLHKGWVSP